jgi:hypothetical protein
MWSNPNLKTFMSFRDIANFQKVLNFQPEMTFYITFNAFSINLFFQNKFLPIHKELSDKTCYKNFDFSNKKDKIKFELLENSFLSEIFYLHCIFRLFTQVLWLLTQPFH